MDEPDFKFDPTRDYTHDELIPLYRKILGPGPDPTVSLGLITFSAAVDWLDRQHRNYIAPLGERSGLLKAMRLRSRVKLVGLANE